MNLETFEAEGVLSTETGDQLVHKAKGILISRALRMLQEAFLIQDTAERGVSREQLAKIVAFVSKMADRWCETFGEHRGEKLQADAFNLYHANHWVILPATKGYGKRGCSLVEVMAVDVQRPHWFVSHAWIEPRPRSFWERSAWRRFV